MTLASYLSRNIQIALPDNWYEEELPPARVTVCPRYERLVELTGHVQKGRVLRYFEDPTSQLLELLAIADGETRWSDLDDTAFLSEYLCMYTNQYGMGTMYPSLSKQFGVNASLVSKVLDLKFDQVSARRRKIVVAEEIIIEKEPDTIDKYVNDMHHAKSSFMMDPIYDSEANHYKAMDARVGELTTILSIIPEDVVIQIPGDGIGAGSLACLAQDREYVSSEPNDIGARAVRLGLITNRDTCEEHVARCEDPKALYLLSNLSRFVDMNELSQRVKAVIYDVSRVRYYGYVVLDQHGYLQTNDDRVSMDQSRLRLAKPPLLCFDAMCGVPKMRDRDSESVRKILEDNNKYDPKSEYFAVLTRMDAVADSDFIVADRKRLCDPPYRDGVVSANSGWVHRRHSGCNVIMTSSSMDIKYYSQSQDLTTLSPSYDMSGNPEMRFVLSFNPIRLKFCYNFNEKVPMTLLRSEKKSEFQWIADIALGTRVVHVEDLPKHPTVYVSPRPVSAYCPRAAVSRLSKQGPIKKARPLDSVIK